MEIAIGLIGAFFFGFVFGAFCIMRAFEVDFKRGWTTARGKLYKVEEMKP